MKIFSLILLVMIMISFRATASFALPAFARKYNLSCTSCHTKPPRLNSFGEAFHMAGFQIPMVTEGELRAKRRIGSIFSETHLLDIFSVVARGDLARYTSKKSSLPFPENIELYLAGTFTDAISYFFEFEHERENDLGNPTFGLGKEAFVMINLPVLFRPGSHTMSSHGAVHGPMMMVGKIDPSTNFSYPTNRQIIENVPSYAFASKFFGLMTADKNPLLVSHPVLYNTTGSPGIDLHAMLGNAIIQAGVMEGNNANPSDENNKKDFYLMGRINLGGASYISGSLSSFGYFGYDTALVSTAATITAATSSALVDWRRVGIGGNIKYRFLDLYGAYIEDTLQNLPTTVSSGFDKHAAGFTIEGDYLTSDRHLVSLRYDHMRAGGAPERQNGSVLTLQSRYYLRDNFSFYLRNSIHNESVQNVIASGLNFDF